MDKFQLLIFLVMVLGIAGLAAFAYVFIGGSAASGHKSGMRDLMGTSPVPERTGRKNAQGIDPLDLDVDTFKKHSAKTGRKSKVEDLPRKLFKAGLYSAEERRKFTRFRIISAVVSTISLPTGMLMVSGNPMLGVVGGVLGVLIGFALPMTILERRIRAREDDVMYYLPLVIEQVSIGVSSALDVGPCIAQIVSMASERDSHNAVTEMFVHVEKLIRSGLNLEDSLQEVGEANGMSEVKHAFMFLTQCSRHGGE